MDEGIALGFKNYLSKNKNKEEVSNTRQEKLLGKINFVEFGQYPYDVNKFGLQLGFEIDNYGLIRVFDDKRYIADLSQPWDRSGIDILLDIKNMINNIKELLKNANVKYISGLFGKLVEVTFVNDGIEDFKVLDK